MTNSSYELRRVLLHRMTINSEHHNVMFDCTRPMARPEAISTGTRGYIYREHEARPINYRERMTLTSMTLRTSNRRVIVHDCCLTSFEDNSALSYHKQAEGFFML